MAARLAGSEGVAAIELNISCPNVSGGVDLGTDPVACEQVVAGTRAACEIPIIAKLTPNVTDIRAIARAAEAGGADAISAINTCLGMAVDWRKRRPLLGNVMGDDEAKKRTQNKYEIAGVPHGLDAGALTDSMREWGWEVTLIRSFTAPGRWGAGRTWIAAAAAPRRG